MSARQYGEFLRENPVSGEAEALASKGLDAESEAWFRRMRFAGVDVDVGSAIRSPCSGLTTIPEFPLRDWNPQGQRRDTERLAPESLRVGVRGEPVQTTSDLRSFRMQTDPEVRQELRGRYPKHPWPEDPWTAEPTHRARQR